MSSMDTGNYRLCRQQKGKGGTRETLSEHKNVEEVLNALKVIQKVENWEYHCEKEVIYKGTLLDENRNPIDSTPSWVRI